MFQLKTGRQLVLQQEFNRRLLSEYNPHFTLDKYVAYLELKRVIDDIVAEQTRFDTMVDAYQQAAVTSPDSNTFRMSSFISTPHHGAQKGGGASGGMLGSTSHQQFSAAISNLGATMLSNSGVLASNNSHTPDSNAPTTGRKEAPAAAAAAPTQIYTYLYTHKTPNVSPQATHDDDAPPSMSLEMTATNLATAVTPSANIPSALPGRLLLPKPESIERSHARICALHAKFFGDLKHSHRRVKAFLVEKENAAITQIEELRKMTESQLAKLPASTIPAIFRRVRNIALFRDLNTVGFQHIMQKYLEMCCTKSLEQQEKLKAADAIIANSHLCKPTFDADQQLDLITSIYATIRNVSFEAARHDLDLVIERDLSTQQRIMPVTQSYFYTSSFVHHQSQGSFALKLIAGLGAKALTRKVSELSHSDILNFENKIQAGGELAPKLHEAVRGDDVFIVQSMAAAQKRSMSTAIMQLALTMQTLSLASAARTTAVIPYMAYNSNPNASAAIAEMLMVNGCKQVLTLDLRSDQVEGMFGNLPIYSLTALMEFVAYLTDRLIREEQSVRNLCVVSPDGDGVARARRFADAFAKHLNKELFGAESNALHRPCPQIVMPADEGEFFKPPTPAADGSSPQQTVGGGVGVVPSSLDDGATSSKNLTRRQSTLLAGRMLNPTGSSVAAAAAAVRSTLSKEGSPSSLPGTGTATSPGSLGMLSGGGSQVFGKDSAVMMMQPTNSAEAAAAATSSMVMSPSSVAVNLDRVFIPIATALKRPSHECDDIDVIGEVKGQHCFVIDTVIDEAVNATTVAKKLKLNGAIRVTVVATHALFSSDASLDLVAEPWIDELIITDTVAQDDRVLTRPDIAKKIRILSVAPLLAEAIQRLHSDNCLSTLFDR